jgi:hypothetical protein
MLDMTKSRFLSSVVVLAASGGLCAAALAATPYTVKLKVPMSVKPGHTFTVKASGTSASTSRLTVFLSKSCAATAKAESKAAHALINKNVTHGYTSSKTATAPGSTGNFHACAYLTSAGKTRAHASVKYFVVLGGY